MKLLTFLGTGRYQRTTYVWQPADGERHEHTAQYAPAATCHFLRPDAVFVFTTQDAQEAHFTSLCRELGNAVHARPVDIPSGCNEQELWQIFAAVAGCVEHGDTVTLDITHGFRSLPAIGIFVAAFLRTARQVQVEHIVYGAWEARDASVEPPRTPLFDLTPMLSLLEWAVAADRLLRLGDARDMAELLRAARPPWPECARDPSLHGLSRELGRLSAKLDEISHDLQFIRPHATLDAAHKLSRQLAQAEDCAASVRPFAELLAQVRSAFAGLALTEPTRPESLRANLERQRTLVRWYLARQYYVQAATLAREWMVSWTVLQQGGRELLDKSAREAAEQMLGALHAEARAGRRDAREARVMSAEALQVEPLWGLLCDVRNDINHAGMRRGALAPDKLIEKIEYCVQEIERLPL